MYQASAIPAQAYPTYPQTKPTYPLRAARDAEKPRWGTPRGGEGRWRMVAEERGGYDATPTSDAEPAATQTTAEEKWFKGSLPLPTWASDPAWVGQYGRALPLVVYLLTRADWATGRIQGYRHADVATYYGCAPTTIAQQFRLLRQSDKVQVIRHGQYDLDLVLARGAGIHMLHNATTSPRHRRKSPDYQKIDSLNTATARGTDESDQQEVDTLHAAAYQKSDSLTSVAYQEVDSLSAPDYQKIAPRVSKNCDSVLYVTSHTLSPDHSQTDANASGVADSQRAADVTQDSTQDSTQDDEWGRDDQPPVLADVTADTPSKPTPRADAITQRGQSRPPIAPPPQGKQTTKRAALVWPPVRRADERSELDMLLRVVKDALDGSQRVAYLVAIAHDKLGVPTTGDGIYPRMGKLANDAGGAGVLVRHILTASAAHIDGDNPLDYLTKMVHDKTRREGQQGGSRVSRGATSDPARPSRWYSQQRDPNESPAEASAKAVAATRANREARQADPRRRGVDTETQALIAQMEGRLS